MTVREILGGALCGCLGKSDLNDLIKSSARSGARVERPEGCVVELFLAPTLLRFRFLGSHLRWMIDPL